MDNDYENISDEFRDIETNREGVKKSTDLGHIKKIIKFPHGGSYQENSSFEIFSVRRVEKNGVIEDTEEIGLIIDATGLVLNPPAFVLDDGQRIQIDIAAISYTDLKTPSFYHGMCQMCLEEKGLIRRLYLGKDGLLSIDRNALCSECWIENENRKRKYNISWGFLPQEIY